MKTAGDDNDLKVVELTVPAAALIVVIFQPCRSLLLGGTKCSSSCVKSTEVISRLWLCGLSLRQISMASCTTSPTPTGIKLKWWLASPWSSTRSCRSMELTRWGAETNRLWSGKRPTYCYFSVVLSLELRMPSYLYYFFCWCCWNQNRMRSQLLPAHTQKHPEACLAM